MGADYLRFSHGMRDQRESAPALTVALLHRNSVSAHTFSSGALHKRPKPPAKQQERERPEENNRDCRAPSFAHA